MRPEVAQKALEFLGTPYHHQAKVKGLGVDCGQLILAVAQELNLVSPTMRVTNYSTEWHLHNTEEKMLNMLEQFNCVEKTTLEIGDIVCFKFGRVCSHLGIYLGEGQFIHARIDQGKVVINSLSGDWLKRHIKTYSFPLEK